MRGLDAVQRRLRKVSDDQHDAVMMHTLGALPGPFLAWTPHAMRPSVLVAVLSDIILNDRRVIVECGSGNSTVYTARLLRQRGITATFTSIDDNPEWAERTRRQLASEDLADYVSVVTAPIVDGWYDRELLSDVPTGTDLLVVDGPPSKPDPEARRGAIDYFADRLDADATVILDDTRRAGETAVRKQWQATTGRIFRDERGGCSIAAPHVSNDTKQLA